MLRILHCRLPESDNTSQAPQEPSMTFDWSNPSMSLQELPAMPLVPGLPDMPPIPGPDAFNFYPGFMGPSMPMSWENQGALNSSFGMPTYYPSSMQAQMPSNASLFNELQGIMPVSQSTRAEGAPQASEITVTGLSLAHESGSSGTQLASSSADDDEPQPEERLHSTDSDLLDPDVPRGMQMISSTPVRLPGSVRRLAPQRNTRSGSPAVPLIVPITTPRRRASSPPTTGAPPTNTPDLGQQALRRSQPASSPTPGAQPAQDVVLGSRSRTGSHDNNDESDSEKVSRKRDRKSRSVRTVNDDRRKVTKLAYNHFKLMFITEEPWVPWHEADEYADDAWEAACVELQYDLDELQPDSVSRGLIKDRITQLRGAMKTVARGLLAAQYGFKDGRSDAIKAHNRELVACLKADTKGDGYRYKQYFTPGKPMQVLIAQLLTTVECAIDEWKTGTFKEVDFRENVYASIYQKHLSWLIEWEKYSKDRSQADLRMQEDLIRSLRIRAAGGDMDELGGDETDNAHVEYDFSQFE
ncbi:hypothetical protein EVJ58_g6135 [Rhodofomes roseus]|uniref:DUF6532 domain-containing protein n=1 Tax=Rhodofomes roseus TaxID=34475 RepID=A0A4Y9YBC5_9APHY|nr:hypothetical protein EVJ58_g6135 [Rhodofomes roseus]